MKSIVQTDLEQIELKLKVETSVAECVLVLFYDMQKISEALAALSLH